MRGRRRWGLWWLLPIEPFSNRKTVVAEVIPGVMWTFEQLLGAVAVRSGTAPASHPISPAPESRGTSAGVQVNSRTHVP
jgi:hypothetical protein